MVLEFHVYGPGFSLPSIDAQCLATIAYVSQCVPRDQWRLIASSAELNPTGELPALNNGGVWVGGRSNIIDYLGQLDESWKLDRDLEGEEKADVVAFSSFIESKGQELLDLSLYVSSENYNAITRPMHRTLSLFPLSWIKPHQLRAAAKLRTSHLGLSSLDIDSDPVEEKQPDLVQIPESLKRATSNPFSILSSVESTAQIRLHGLARDFLKPLQDLRGQERFLVGDKATSLDCLATAYLSLMLFPDLPSPWLAKTIRGEFQMLGAFVHDTTRLFFGGPVTLQDAGLGEMSTGEKERSQRTRGKDNLPWQAPEAGGLLEVAKAVGSHVAESLPVISDVLRAKRVQTALEEQAEADPDHVEEYALQSLAARQFSKEIFWSVGSVVLGLGFFTAFVINQGVLGGIMGNIKTRVKQQEEAEGGFSWDADPGESVEPGLANLASQMDFLGDLQFVQPQVTGVEGDVVPDRTL